MSCETVSREKPVRAPGVENAAPGAEALAQVMAVVQQDSRREAEQYLQECEVPHGGE